MAHYCKMSLAVTLGLVLLFPGGCQEQSKNTVELQAEIPATEAKPEITFDALTPRQYWMSSTAHYRPVSLSIQCQHDILYLKVNVG